MVCLTVSAVYFNFYKSVIDICAISVKNNDVTIERNTLERKKYMKHTADVVFFKDVFLKLVPRYERRRINATPVAFLA